VCFSWSRFTGKERDAESGNDYFGARYYASSMARFMSPDDGSDQFTSSPQSWNLYSYARNNPVTNTDADGNACVVQTRTSDTTESVSVASQGTCDGVSVGDGQSATYVNGNVNLSDIHAGADGHSVDIGFTSYDGQSSGVQNSGGAPMPDNPGLAYGFGNNAQGYQTLGAASTVVQDATIAVGATYGALGVAAFASGGGGAAVALRLAQMGRVAAATLAGGWKVGQQMARTGAGSPAALLDYAKTAMTNAVQAGTYVQTQFGTIYRDGGNYVVQNFQGAISSVVVNAEAGRGIVTEYLSRGGK
jgi:RHS repeat-associated protein